MSRRTAGVAAGLMLAIALMNPLDAQQAPRRRLPGHRPGHQRDDGAARRRDRGEGGRRGQGHDLDGNRRRLRRSTLTPGAYTLTAELTGFSRVAAGRSTIPADGTCSQTVNLSLTLAPRQPLPATRRARRSKARAPVAGAPAGRARRRTGAGRGRRPRRGDRIPDARRAAAGRSAHRGAGRDAGNRSRRGAALLPPGFSTETSGRRDRDHRQQRQHRSRHDAGSLRRDRPRRVRSGQR